MRWSLNVPLIIWCKRSGASNSWISAQGKSFVNGWNEYPMSFDVFRNECDDRTHHNIVIDSIVMPEFIQVKVSNEHFHVLLCATSSACIIAIQIASRCSTPTSLRSVGQITNKDCILTWHTSSEQSQPAWLVLDNWQCTVPNQRSCSENGHQDSNRWLVLSCCPWCSGIYLKSMNERAGI